MLLIWNPSKIGRAAVQRKSRNGAGGAFTGSCSDRRCTMCRFAEQIRPRTRYTNANGHLPRGRQPSSKLPQDSQEGDKKSMIRRNRFIALWIVLLLSLVLFGVRGVQAQSSAPPEVEWQAQYWNNVELSGIPPLERTEPELNHDWGAGSPGSAIRPDRFSARWTALVDLEGGSYRFASRSDDGIRVWVDGVRIIDNWTVHPETVDAVTVPLDAGQHEIRIEYFENTGLARVALSWERIENVGDESVSISPRSGPAGTELEVTARGFTPNAEVIVGVGWADAEPSTSTTERTNEAGVLQTVVTIPADEARVGEPWVVLVRNVETGEKALSPAFSVTSTSGVACGPTYVVQPGDWLARIARRCGTSVEALLAANPQITDPGLVRPGQVLQIPGEEPAAQLSVTPDRAAPGNQIRVNAIGFAPDTEVVVGIGRANSEPTASKTVTTDGEGVLETTIVLPAEASPGESWVVLATSEEQTVLSEMITVTGTGVTATTRVNLRLRSGPGTGTEILDVVPAGTTVSVSSRTAGGDWIRVTFEGQSGWMAAWYTDVSGDLSDVPVEGRFTQTDIYLIALEDGGERGQLIGCNDSVVPVTVDIEPTQAPLTAALNRLLSIEDAFYGQTELYNALYRSDLSLQDVNIVDGRATISLLGELLLGGTCDAPRVQAQLQQTALQYSTVDEVSILVNGQPLEDALTGQ